MADDKAKKTPTTYDPVNKAAEMLKKSVAKYATPPKKKPVEAPAPPAKPESSWLGGLRDAVFGAPKKEEGKY
jgi:hypothetical protein